MSQFDEAPRSASIGERIERLPVGRFHRRFIALVSLGGWFDLYDLFMVAYVGAALQTSGFLSLREFTSLVAAGFLGMFVGTIFFGMGSDRMGRRSSFVVMLLVYSFFTLAGAFAPSAAWLIGLRFFAGIGIGAEIVVIDTYVTEMVPRDVRGRFVAITQVVGFAAVPCVAILSRLLVPTHFLMSGWRWVMVIGASGAALAWYFRRRLPESPRWLESQGRIAEAERVVAMLEVESGYVAESRNAVVAVIPGAAERENNSAAAQGARRYSSAPSRHQADASAPRKRKTIQASLAAIAELWSPAYRKRTAMLVIFQALQTFGFYGFSNWAPTFLLKRGFTLLHSLKYTLLIALVAPLGPLFAAATSDRMERKWTIAALAILVAAFGLGFALWRAPALIVLSGAAVTLCNNAFSANFHAYQSELFPTRIRATGVGFTYAWSRLSAAFSSFIIAWVLVRGVSAVFTMLAAAMVGVALVIALLGPRTNRLSLEELAG
jgi:putative MFS transporter